MKTLTRQADDTHRVVCTRCDLWHIHADVRDAVNEYVDHDCNEES